MFADRARQLLALSNVIQKEIVDFSSGYKGNLYIGITPTAVPLVLSPKIAEFHQNYPMINFEFFEGNSAYIHDLVQKRHHRYWHYPFPPSIFRVSNI